MIGFRYNIIIFMLMFSSCSSLKKLYVSEVRESLSKNSVPKIGYYSEDDFSALPEPVKKYFKYCGYIGKEKINTIQIDYDNAFIKMSPEKKWTKIKYYQVNFTDNPTRLAYISSRIIGMFAFEGRDKYQNGEGNMRIRLVKMFTVANAKGKEMDESALVTLLSEVLFMPDLAIQEQIEWNSMDSTSVKATFRDEGHEVSGIFYFNDQNECIQFTTKDRFYWQKDGSYKNIRWSIELSDYTDLNGIKFPTDVKVIWHMDEGDFEYFKAKVIDVRHNINDQLYSKIQ